MNIGTFIASLLLITLVSCSRNNNSTTELPEESLRNAYGGSRTENFSSGYPTGDGGMLAIGGTNSIDGDVIGDSQGFDVWLVRFDGGRNIIWQKKIGGNKDDAALMVPTNDNKYLIAGFSTSNDGIFAGNHGSTDAWAAKIDTAGTIIWKTVLGSSAYDCVYGAVATSDNGYILLGYSMGNNDGDIPGNKGMSDAWVVKLDNQGNKLWSKLYGGNYAEDLYSAIATPDGGCLAIGSTQSISGNDVASHGSYDGWVLKLDQNGNVQWQKTYGGADWEDFKTIIKSGSTFWLAGQTSQNSGAGRRSDGYVVQIDVNGNVLNQSSFGGNGNDEINGLAIDDKKQIIATGVSRSSDIPGTTLHGEGDGWIVRLNESGNVISHMFVGGSKDDVAGPIVFTSKGKSWLLAATESSDNDILGFHGEIDAVIYPLNW